MASGSARNSVRVRSGQRGKPADNIDIAVDRIGNNSIRDTADITVVDDIGGTGEVVCAEGGIDDNTTGGTGAGGRDIRGVYNRAAGALCRNAQTGYVPSCHRNVRIS